MSERINISLIDYKRYQNDTLNDILTSVNGYLLRNKGAVSDFNLVKDIVDRNIYIWSLLSKSSNSEVIFFLPPFIDWCIGITSREYRRNWIDRLMGTG